MGWASCYELRPLSAMGSKLRREHLEIAAPWASRRPLHVDVPDLWALPPRGFVSGGEQSSVQSIEDSCSFRRKEKCSLPYSDVNAALYSGRNMRMGIDRKADVMLAGRKRIDRGSSL